MRKPAEVWMAMPPPAVMPVWERPVPLPAGRNDGPPVRNGFTERPGSVYLASSGYCQVVRVRV